MRINPESRFFLIKLVIIIFFILNFSALIWLIGKSKFSGHYASWGKDNHYGVMDSTAGDSYSSSSDFDEFVEKVKQDVKSLYEDLFGDE